MSGPVRLDELLPALVDQLAGDTSSPPMGRCPLCGRDVALCGNKNTFRCVDCKLEGSGDLERVALQVTDRDGRGPGGPS